MKLGARTIPAMAVAVFLVPALFADDTAKPADKPRKAESADAAAAPAAPAKPALAGKAPLALSRQDPAGGAVGRHSERHGRRSGGHGRSTPKVELFLGYSYWRALPDSHGNRIIAMHGGSASLAYNLNPHLGLVFDVAGFNTDSLQFSNLGAGFTPSRVVDADGKAFTFLFGPRVSFRSHHDRLTPFLQILGGAAHTTEVTVNGCPVPILVCVPLPEETAFAMTAGGGVDFRLNHRVALRLLQAEFLLTRFQDPSSATLDSGWQSNIRLSAGLVFAFGGGAPPPPPNRFPVASCSADKTTAYAGSGDTAAVHATASDPDGDPLTYSWTATGGTVEGNGPDARWSSSGADPGTYAVKARVTDGRDGVAECSASIRVEPQPNRAPTMSCSANPTTAVVGEPVAITASASDPDNDSLTYSWKSSGGRIRGRDASAKLDTAGLKAGHYAVTGHVEDGKGGAADCQLGIELQEPPTPPEMVELEKRLDLHSIYFPTARPTAARPTGGLVGSQEQILVVLAEDFKKYLAFKPEAHLILGGHADERGSQEYNKALTERRVERTKNFLTEHGVPEANIETRSFGEEDNLNAEQVKEQIAQNPDITPGERQQMLSNLNVMVLANNRRVDVALSTTGQQSVHRYPFNARDYLTLINTKSGEHQARPKKKSKP